MAATAVQDLHQSVKTTPAEKQGILLKETDIWFSYRGRIGVGQYWGRLLIGIAGVFGVALLIYTSADTADAVNTADAVVGLLWLFSIWPSTALAWKRLHDTGRSGGYFFLTLIPLAGPIIWLVFSLQGSAPGPNEYGPKAGYRY